MLFMLIGILGDVIYVNYVEVYWVFYCLIVLLLVFWVVSSVVWWLFEYLGVEVDLWFDFD